jgi:hypothetical protein
MKNIAERTWEVTQNKDKLGFVRRLGRVPNAAEKREKR